MYFFFESRDSWSPLSSGLGDGVAAAAAAAVVDCMIEVFMILQDCEPILLALPDLACWLLVFSEKA